MVESSILGKGYDEGLIFKNEVLKNHLSYKWFHYI